MSLLASLLGQVTPGSTVPQNPGSYGTNGLTNLLSGNTKDLLTLLKEYFKDSPKLVEKNGKIGFDTTGLTTTQVASLKTALQNSLDDLFGGAIQLSQDADVLGVDTTGLSDKDKTALQALFESIDLVGNSLTQDQKATVAQAITGILNSPSLFIVKGGTPSVGSAGAGASGGQIPIPPPSTPQPPPSQYAFLAGLLAVKAGDVALSSVQSTDTALGEIQKEQANQLMNDIIKSVQDQQKNADKAKVAKIFGWVVSIALIIIGVVLTVAGALTSWVGGAGVGLAALGVGLVVGGVIGCIMASKVGDEITTKLTTALEKDGLSKTDAAIVATIIIVAATIVISIGAGAVAAPISGAINAAVVGTEAAAEGAIDAGATAAEIGAEAGAEGAGAAGEAGGAVVEGASAALRTSTQLIRLIKAAVTLFNTITTLGNVGLSVSQGIAELQLGNSEKTYLRELALTKQIAATLNLLLKSLEGTLDGLNTDISNAAGVIGQTPAIASFATTGKSA